MGLYIYIIYTSQSVFGVLGFIYVYYIYCINIYIYMHIQNTDIHLIQIHVCCGIICVYIHMNMYTSVYIIIIYIHILADRYV